MQGDFNRYLAEVTDGQTRDAAIEGAKKAYEEGLNIAQEVLRYSHPLRLNVILNYAILVHEFSHNTTKAIEFLEQALKGLRKEGSESISKEDKEEVALLRQIIEININVCIKELMNTGY